MDRGFSLRKGMAFILAMLLMFGQMFLMKPVKVSAANFLFITDIRLSAGENAYDDLENAGYSVMTIGLNTGTEDTTPVFLGYKMNEGTPITNLLIRENVGEGFDTEEGIHYILSGDVDVDEGREIKTGCIYYTTDKRAGESLVSLDILRADADKEEELPAIPNDGSVVVRKTDNTPADIEAGRQDVVMYLLMIRDNLVRPYVREFALVTDEDRWNAIYTAAERGFDYFIDADLDEKKDTFTILAYNRTADPDQAVTSVIAVKKELADLMEKNQMIAFPEEEQVIDELDSKPVKAGTVNDGSGESTETGPQTENTSETTGEVRSVAILLAEDVDGLVITDSQDGTGAGPETGEGSETQEVTETQSESETETETGSEAESETESDTESETETDTDTETEEETTEEETTEEIETETETEEETEEETREVLTGEAIDISGIEYVRVSKDAVQAETPYYLYYTKNPEAGNPVSLFYTGWQNLSTETFFGMWTYGFFSAEGISHANSYTINEDLLTELQTDRTVYINLPVSLLGGSITEDNKKEEIIPEITTLPLSVLTKKEGLPQDRVVINGLTKRVENPPVIERNERSDRTNQFSGSAFSDTNLPVIIAGAAVIVLSAAAVTVVLSRRRKKTSRNKE